MSFNNYCPYCSDRENIIRWGIRKLKKGEVQKLYCKKCNRHFSSSVHPFSLYPDRPIIRSIDLYNRGISVVDIISTIEREFGVNVPERTVYSWLQRYGKTFDLYLLKRCGREKIIQPIETVPIDGNGSERMMYHRLKMASSCCKNDGLLDYIGVLDTHFDPERAREHPNYKNCDQRGRMIDNGHQDKCVILRDLHTRLNGGYDLESLKEFILLNHPGSVVVNLPLDVPDDDSKISDGPPDLIDLIVKENDGFLLVRMEEGKVLSRKSRKRFNILVNSFRLLTGEKVAASRILFPDRMVSVKS